MTSRDLQNLLHPAQLLQPQSGANQYALADDRTGLFDRIAHRARNYLVERIKDYKHEAETREAMRHLQELSDHQLRDLGITRHDISRVVRLGKESI